MSEQQTVNKTELATIPIYCINVLLLFLLVFTLVIKPNSLSLYLAPFQNVVYCFSFLAILSILAFKPNLCNTKIPINLFDVAFVGFILVNFCSWFWANQPALIWGKSFAYLQLYLLFKTIQIINPKVFYRKHFETTIIIICIINCLIIVTCFVQVMIKPDGFYLLYQDLSKVLKYIKGNGNYVSSLLVMLLPCLLLIERKSLLIYALIIFQTGLVLLFNSRGSTLALLILALFLIVIYYNKNAIKNYYKLIAILILIVLPMFLFIGDKERFFTKYSIESPFDEQSNNERLKLWNKSFTLFKEQPILGVGSGNWRIEHLKYGSSDLNISFNEFKTYNHAHNLFIELIAELGLLGTTSIIIIFAFLLFEFFKTKRLTEKVTFSFVLCYAILASFYGVVYITNATIKPHIIILFIALAFSIKRNKIFLNFKVIVVSLLFFAGLNSIWHSYQLNVSTKMWDINHAISIKKHDAALNGIKKVYWKDVNEYFGTKPLKILSAETLIKKKKIGNAVTHYKMGLKNDPYNYKWLTDFANLLDEKEYTTEAQKTYSRAYRLNNNIFNTNIWLANHTIKKKKSLVEFNEYLSFYEEWILPTKEKNYSELVWNEKSNSKAVRFWRKLCNYEDRVLILLKRYKQ